MGESVLSHILYHAELSGFLRVGLLIMTVVVVVVIMFSGRGP